MAFVDTATLGVRSLVLSTTTSRTNRKAGNDGSVRDQVAQTEQGDTNTAQHSSQRERSKYFSVVGHTVGDHGKYSLNQNGWFLFDGARPCYYHCSERQGVKKVNNHHFFTDPQIFSGLQFQLFDLFIGWWGKSCPCSLIGACAAE